MLSSICVICHIIHYHAYVDLCMFNLIAGLDDVLAPHIASFEEANFSGKQLLCLSYGDLEALHITKLGHQELILEAVELLSELVSHLFHISIPL